MDNIELNNRALVKCKPLTIDEFERLNMRASNGPVDKFKRQFGMNAFMVDNEEVIVSDNGILYAFSQYK